jgi:Methylamine utilisation protein MauE
VRSGAPRQFLRFAIGAVLLASAAGKLLDIAGFSSVLKTYEAFPDGILLPLAIAIPLAELALALWLFSGQFLAAAAITSVVMHLAYAVWSAVSVLRGLRLSNCGCFGVFWPRPLGWTTVAEDLVLAAASFALAILARKRLPLPAGEGWGEGLA